MREYSGATNPVPAGTAQACMENLRGAVSEAFERADWIRQRLGGKDDRKHGPSAVPNGLVQDIDAEAGRVRNIVEILREIQGALGD